jgi:hypothetical protein
MRGKETHPRCTMVKGGGGEERRVSTVVKGGGGEDRRVSTMVKRTKGTETHTCRAVMVEERRWRGAERKHSVVKGGGGEERRVRESQCACSPSRYGKDPSL